MYIKDCMTKNVCCCNTNSTIEEVAQQMNENHVGCVPICDANKNIVGVITDRDIILRTVACGKNPKQTKASDIMTCNPCCCKQEDNVDEALEQMSKMQIRRIPICDDTNKVVGILTLGDIVSNENIGEQSVCYTIENICNCSNQPKNAE